MAMGRRKRERQGELWISMQDVPQSKGHPIYQKLNQLLDEAGFDEVVESLCRPFYAAHLGARPSRRACTYGCCWWATSRASTPNGASRGGVRTSCRSSRFWGTV